VDGHVFSPTFRCGWTRVFTHRTFVISPTEPPRKASNGAGLRNRNARAQFLTYKVFNGRPTTSPVDNLPRDISGNNFIVPPRPLGAGISRR
jgi:hypothetical protein